MRTLLFSNMTTWDKNKRDIYVKESVEKDGILANTSRRCLYFIKERVKIDDPSDLKQIAALKLNEEKNKRHFYVLKEHYSEEGIDKLMCKVAGTFYAMVNDYLYCILFVHTFKISFTVVTE